MKKDKRLEISDIADMAIRSKDDFATIIYEIMTDKGIKYLNKKVIKNAISRCSNTDIIKTFFSRFVSCRYFSPEQRRELLDTLRNGFDSHIMCKSYCIGDGISTNLVYIFSFYDKMTVIEYAGDITNASTCNVESSYYEQISGGGDMLMWIIDTIDRDFNKVGTIQSVTINLYSKLTRDLVTKISF